MAIAEDGRRDSVQGRAKDGVPSGGEGCALVLFTRIPVAGRVKTRLLPALSGEDCARLQRAMALDLAERAGALGLPLTVCYSDEAVGLGAGGDALEAAFLDEMKLAAQGECAGVRCDAGFGAGADADDGARGGSARIAGRRVLRCAPQQGAGLGQRMAHALDDELAAGARGCLLMGSDLPLVATETLRQTLRVFEENDAVLCPSTDGGYWLVGLHASLPELFAGKRYGGASVLEDALESCKHAGVAVGLGPVSNDVDTPDDLANLEALVRTGDPRVGRRTAEVIRHMSAF